MDRTVSLSLLQKAAALISLGTSNEIGAIWNITIDFPAARARVLPGKLTKPARTYLQLLDGLVATGVSKGDPNLLDSALLSVCLAVSVGLDDVGDAELAAAVSMLFAPPLARPHGLDLFRARIQPS